MGPLHAYSVSCPYTRCDTIQVQEIQNARGWPLQFTAQIVSTIRDGGAILFFASQPPFHTRRLALLPTKADVVESNPGPARCRQEQLDPQESRMEWA